MEQTNWYSNTIRRRDVMASGMVAALAGCAAPHLPQGTAIENSGAAYGFEGVRPLDLDPSNLSKITVCLRPFRPAGPRLETERAGGKLLIHNYGHGGSGWSLAWGYAVGARDFLSQEGARNVSVIGAGALGLTSAIAIAETGAKVTIFAREMPMESASANATGVWSPSSRIGMQAAIAPDFAERWEALARRSYARHLSYVGRAGAPVEFTPRFYIRADTREHPLATRPEGAASFLHLGRSLRGLAPPWSTREHHPFPSESAVRGGLVMTFNIAEYMRQLKQDFLALGGRIERAKLNSKSDMLSLPGDAIVNCTGLDAKTLADDQTLVPVRGQIAWMPAQTDRLYGVHYRGVTALSRRDGLLIQETGGSDFYGLGDDNKAPSREEFLAARAKIAPMFEWKGTGSRKSS